MQSTKQSIKDKLKQLGLAAAQTIGNLNPLKYVGGIPLAHIITGGAVGNTIGSKLGRLVGDGAYGGQIGEALLGFKKGGRVKKSGKYLVHKKEYVVKKGKKVTKKQMKKVAKRSKKTK